MSVDHNLPQSGTLPELRSRVASPGGGYRLALRLCRSPLTPVLVGSLLLVASGLKGYELATESTPERNLWTSRSFLVPLVLLEFALAVWLFSGFKLSLARKAALACFLIFLEFALYQALANELSCSCLGKYSPPPWVMFFLDLSVLFALSVWRPTAAEPDVAVQRWRFTMAVAILALIGIPAVIHMIYYVPTGVVHYLREDPQLQTRLNVLTRGATTEQLIGKLGQVTGLRLTADPIFDDSPAAFGELQLRGVYAWALMELAAQKQPVSARWDRRQDGYQLVTALPWGSRFLPSALGIILSSLVLGAGHLTGYVPSRFGSFSVTDRTQANVSPVAISYERP